MPTTGLISSAQRACNDTCPPERGLHSAGVLRWPNKLVIDDVAVTNRLRGWREHSPIEGELWLRRVADSGDFYAMESLGLRLFNGWGTRKSQEEGIEWLRKAAHLGSSVAMIRLSECLLEDDASPHSATQAEDWLLRALRAGNHQAAIVLGSRLVIGAGLSVDSSRGMRFLYQAAEQRSQLAHIKLGVHLLSGRELKHDRDDGLGWFTRIGATQPNHISSLAHYVYMKSLAAPTKGSARILAEEAAFLFREAARQGCPEQEINLAYLLRRGEISTERYPSIEALLSRHVRQSDSFALMNQALCLAKGTGCTADWQVADILVRRIRKADSILRWWFSRSEDDDGEGHLVTGWLARHRLASDPEQLPLKQRLDRARRSGWPAPPWMDHHSTLPDAA